MRYTITGRNIEITDGLKKAVEEKLQKLEKYFTAETEARVTLSVQKEAHKIARHEVKCTLEDCMMAARHLLKQGGRLMMVHRAERLMDVLTEMRNASIEPKRVVFIYSKIDKSAVTIVVEGRKNGNQGLTIAPPFYIYNNQGDYTDEMKEVYYG